MSTPGELDWERAWAPYDEPTYAAALAWVHPNDVVLEIGAGDLRLARRLAARAHFVYALEINASLALNSNAPRPANLQLLIGDARTLPFPSGLTLGVILMRHCRHLGLYWDKLVAADATRLITNARWRLAPELIALDAPRCRYAEAPPGWYACRCGAVGFVEGSADQLASNQLEQVCEVMDCPACRQRWPIRLISPDSHPLETPII